MEEDQNDDNISNQARAMVVVEDKTVVAIPNEDYSSFDCVEENANKIIEEKMFDIAQILGITMDG